MMSKWEMVRLGDVITVTSGGTPSRTNADNWAKNTDGSLFPWVKTGDLKSMYLTEVEEYITACGLENSSAKLFPSNTVLLAMYGATIGACSILKIDATTNQACAALLPTEKYMAQFLYYYLASIKPKLVSLGVGGAQPNISGTIIKSLQIPMPSIAIQHKITSVLDHASALIEKRKAQIAKLDLLVKSQFIAMFGFPIINTMGWDKKPFGRTCVITTGNTPPRANKEYYGDYIEWIKTDNIQSTNSILTPALECLSKQGFEKCRYVEANSILMTCIAGSLNSIGNVAISDRRVAFNQQINALTPKEYNYLFLYWLLKLIKDEIHTSVNMMLKGILSKGNLSEIKAIVPPIDSQNRFADFVNITTKTKIEISQGLDKLELLYKSLMQKCFNGEMLQYGR